MYKVFFEDRLFIISDFPISKNDYKGVLHIPYTTKSCISENLNLIRDDITVNTINIYHREIGKIFNEFVGFFTWIEAAGGIVFNDSGKILFILRNNKWDLPKGKSETGETIETTALREVEEECGIKNMFIERFLNHTYHTYESDDQRILKKTWWYKMKYTGESIFHPQTEEGISDIKWVEPADMGTVLCNSYSSIRDLLSVFYPGS